MKRHSSVKVANYFIDKAKFEHRGLHPMQIVKMVYIANGWHLGYFDEPLISDKIEAWDFGPNIPKLYGKVLYMGGGMSDRLSEGFGGFFAKDFDDNQKKLLDTVYVNHCTFSGLQLAVMAADSAWKATTVNTEMDMEAIKAIYKQKVNS